jgi:hypothetical protein
MSDDPDQNKQNDAPSSAPRRRAILKVNIAMLEELLGLEPGVHIHFVKAAFPLFESDDIQIGIAGGSLPQCEEGHIAPDVQLMFEIRGEPRRCFARWSLDPAKEWKCRFIPSALLTSMPPAQQPDNVVPLGKRSDEPGGGT